MYETVQKKRTTQLLRLPVATRASIDFRFPSPTSVSMQREKKENILMKIRKWKHTQKKRKTALRRDENRSHGFCLGHDELFVQYPDIWRHLHFFSFSFLHTKKKGNHHFPRLICNGNNSQWFRFFSRFGVLLLRILEKSLFFFCC